MTPTQIYKRAIEVGMTADFRPKTVIQKMLTRRREQYEKLSGKEKEVHDQELLTNPYSDTRILYLLEDKPIKRALVGIDIDGEELLLAQRLQNIDLVIAHHPRGVALARLDEVMHLQADILAQVGVPINIAESILRPRISEVARSIAPSNHNRSVDMAKLLGLNFLCVHTPTDNLVAQFLKKSIERAKPEFIGDLLKHLLTIPEYEEAAKIGAGPKLFSGSEDRHCGKVVFVEVTGGTEGAPDMYERLAHAGVGTVVGMHMSDKNKEAAEKAHINVVAAGHMSSDSIGMNLFLDELEKKGVEIIPCGGLIRVSRVKKKRRK